MSDSATGSTGKGISARSCTLPVGEPRETRKGRVNEPREKNNASGGNR